MSTSLEGKIALVTGGSRGIGLAISRKLLAAGASVAICGRSQTSVLAAVEQLSKETGAVHHSRIGGKVAGKAADVAKQTDVELLFRSVDEMFGGLDILVNNAGIGVFASVAELSIEDWKRTLDTNLNGVFYCSKAALERFRKRGGGAIVNISSLAGKNPFAGGSAYNASKFGLNGFSEAMMLDHRYDNVRVSYIMPGSVDTGFSPQGTKGSSWKIAPEDVADAVMAVLSMPERTLISRIEMRPLKPGK